MGVTTFPLPGNVGVPASAGKGHQNGHQAAIGHLLSKLSMAWDR